MAIHKYINFDNLPKQTDPRYRGIDWKKSIGNKVYFEYDSIKGFLEIIDYTKNGQYLTLKYKDNLFRMKTGNLMKVHLGKILNKITLDFKVDIETCFKDDKRDLIIINRQYKKDNNGKTKKYYKYKCNNCGWDEGWIDEYSLLGGQGCSCCAGRTVVKGINDIATTDPWMIEYLVNKEDAYKYTSGSRKRIDMKCPDCDNIRKNYVISKLREFHFLPCQCSDGKSYAEKFVYNVFSQLGTNIVTQYNKSHAEWCGKYKYDLYIDNFYMIEVNGEQHYIDCLMNNHNVNKQIEIDNLKRDLAISNGIKHYLELDCRHSNKNYIKASILNSDLINYFDFSKVDWDKANEFATSNLIKVTCEYYEKQKFKMLISEMLIELNLSHTTFLIYLKRGNELGWCNYNKEDTYKYCKKISPCNIRKVRVIELNKIYDSITKCSQDLEKIYGKYFGISNIVSVCRGYKKSYKGFHFEYVD